MTYTDTMDYLVEHTNLTKPMLFDFQGTAGNDYFVKLFTFYTENLSRNNKFGTNPSYIVFYNQNRIYAEAKKSGGIYIIAFDKGIINQLETWFGTYFDFANINGLEEFKTLEAKINYPISELIAQSIYHYTFYHEFGHLIQYANEEKKEFDREDYLAGNCDYNSSSHTEEYDADTFAGIAVATHLFQYIEKWIEADLSETELNDFISVIVGAVMLYVLNIPMCKEEFYTRESTHPNNTIRALNILNVIQKQFGRIIEGKGDPHRINATDICVKSDLVIEKLLNHFHLSQIYVRFKDDIQNHRREIPEYDKYLRDEIIDYKHSAVNQWNYHSKSK